jgi:hypothetical protein
MQPNENAHAPALKTPRQEKMMITGISIEWLASNLTTTFCVGSVGNEVSE